jgi:AcrR family transcriptional regulator
VSTVRAAETVGEGRRERNKARTRQALLDATRSLAAERGMHRTTVEAITEAAGVSRRTFFNYFGGLEALLAEATAEPLQRMADAFLRRPAEEDPLAAVIAALRDRPIDAEILDWAPQDQEDLRTAGPLHQHVWTHHERWLVEVLRKRLGPEAEDLRLRTLAATVMAVFAAVEACWLEQRQGLDPQESLDLFNTELVRGLEHVRQGWRTA